jgi:LacI family transcriptional regulator
MMTVFSPAPPRERPVPGPLRVALLIECSRSYGRNLLAGIAAYARVFGPWTFYHEERAMGDPMPRGLKDWQPQGIITRLDSESMARQVCRLKRPTVGVLHDRKVAGIPGVICDHAAIVRLAVEHLLERRLEHFAYCGLAGAMFSENRSRHFVQTLAAFGHPVHVFQYRRRRGLKRLADVEKDAMQHAGRLAAWLQNLPKPVGLMACNDMRAYQVLNVCREHEILVPDEVAVIGVDNDAVQCELCDPPLSSVDNNAQRVGYEAAALLDRMIRRRGPVPAMTLVEPAGVVARRSTDVLAIADREFVEIVRHVRDHACVGLTPAGLAQHTAVSRSTLERRFAKHLGRSVNEEVCRVRLDRVKELLRTSDLPLGEIARRSGFGYSETMQRVFKHAVGQTPGQYRNCRRVVGPAAAEPGR